MVPGCKVHCMIRHEAGAPLNTCCVKIQCSSVTAGDSCPVYKLINQIKLITVKTLNINSSKLCRCDYANEHVYSLQRQKNQTI